MNLSREWLSDYTKIDVSDKEFCDGMTMTGSKVETVSRTGEGIEEWAQWLREQITAWNA